MNSQPNTTLACLTAVVAGCILCAAMGCAQWDPWGPGFHDEYTNWGNGLRGEKADLGLMGVDGRSREIERNLGVR